MKVSRGKDKKKREGRTGGRRDKMAQRTDYKSKKKEKKGWI